MEIHNLLPTVSPLERGLRGVLIKNPDVKVGI